MSCVFEHVITVLCLRTCHNYHESQNMSSLSCVLEHVITVLCLRTCHNCLESQNMSSLSCVLEHVITDTKLQIMSLLLKKNNMRVTYDLTLSMSSFTYLLYLYFNPFYRSFIFALFYFLHQFPYLLHGCYNYSISIDALSASMFYLHGCSI